MRRKIIWSLGLSISLLCLSSAKVQTMNAATLSGESWRKSNSETVLPLRDHLDSRAGAETQGDFTVGNKTFLLNGKPFVVKAAELHYPRIPKPYWDQRIKLCKALGMNTICLYVFWNSHEQQPDTFDFTGQNDLAEFCRLCQENDMYVILRPGPYVCAEW